MRQTREAQLERIHRHYGTTHIPAEMGRVESTCRFTPLPVLPRAHSELFLFDATRLYLTGVVPKITSGCMGTSSEYNGSWKWLEHPSSILSVPYWLSQ